MSVHVPHLAITMGDPAGIGPEIVVKACRRLTPRVAAGELRLLVVGHRSALDAAARQLAEPDGLDAFTEADYQKHLVGRALQVMQAEFQLATWKACWEHVALGRPAQAVAAELGISVNAVYLATSRVLRRLRQELRGLLD